MANLMRRAAETCRAAVRSVAGETWQIVPMTHGASVNGDLVRDPSRAAFTSLQVSYRQSGDRRDVPPDFVFSDSARSMQDQYDLILRVSEPPVDIRVDDRAQDVDAGVWYSVAGVDADRLGTVILRLSESKAPPEVV